MAKNITIVVLVFYLTCLFPSVLGIQSWISQPGYQEVNPGGEVIMPCRIRNKQGECRWSRDGTPMTVFPNKYEWAGLENSGDCSLRILKAELKFDDGDWQCQVTPSRYNTSDSLISEGAQLVVRGE